MRANADRRTFVSAYGPVWRRWLVGALLAALLAPILAGLLPAPALSAAQSVERAAALALCATPGERKEDGGGQQHEGQCQLCVLGCAACCVASPADVAQRQGDDPLGSPRVIAIFRAEPVLLAPPARPLQPRAPPVSLT